MGRDITVLVVERDVAEAMALGLRLQPRQKGEVGVRLLHAGSVAAACRMLGDTPVDVVFLGLSLPDAAALEGLDTVRHASTIVPVIVMATETDEPLALEALGRGAQDYVVKPPPAGRALRRIVRRAQQRQQQLDRLEASLRASELSARGWRVLAETDRALAATDPSDLVLDGIADLTVPALADCFLLLLTAEESAAGELHVAHTDAGCARRLRELLAGGAAGVLAGTRALGDAAALSLAEAPPALVPVVEALGPATGFVLPLRVAGRVKGVLLLASVQGRPDAVLDAVFARLLADRIELALGMAQLLRDAQRAIAARDRAFSIVSHDLRNPLLTIQVCAQALLEQPAPPPAGVRSMAHMVERSAAWMSRMVHDLNDRATLDSGKLVLNRMPISVAESFAAAQVMYAPLATEEGVRFSVEIGQGVSLVDADPHRLLQILVNLLGNAVKYTPAGGWVILSAQAARVQDRPAPHEHGGVRFSVSDTGPGIPQDELAHIFEWFWQGPGATRGGAGLGLAIAQGLVEAHGSRLHVESEPGRGSTFWFVLPSPGPAPVTVEMPAAGPAGP